METTHKYRTACGIAQFSSMIMRRMNYRNLKLSIKYLKAKATMYHNRNWMSDPKFYLQGLAKTVNCIGIRGQNLGSFNMRGANLGFQWTYVGGFSRPPCQVGRDSFRNGTVNQD